VQTAIQRAHIFVVLIVFLKTKLFSHQIDTHIRKVKTNHADILQPRDVLDQNESEHTTTNK